MPASATLLHYLREIREIYPPTRRLSLSDPAIGTISEASGAYFLPREYSSRSNPDYFDDEPQKGIECQPEVYAKARRIAIQRGCSTIIDVGCGHARKLIRVHPDFNVIGIDVGNNIEFCRREYGFGRWIEHDLDSERPLPLEIGDLHGSVIVCADVLEHLIRPERALRAMLDASEHADALLISTPDRERVRNEQAMGPPSNPSHVREWSKPELASLLRSCGFADGYIVHTRSRTRSISLATLLYVRADTG